MRMTCPTAVDGGPLAKHLAVHIESAVTELWPSGHEVHHPAQGITAVHDTAGPHHHLGLGNGEGVYGACILDVT